MRIGPLETVWCYIWTLGSEVKYTKLGALQYTMSELAKRIESEIEVYVLGPELP